MVLREKGDNGLEGEGQILTYPNKCHSISNKEIFDK